MFFRVRVGEVGRDDVCDPAEHARRADPRDARQHEPEYAPEDLAVVNLSEAGNQETENACNQRVAHLLKPPCPTIRVASRVCSAQAMIRINSLYCGALSFVRTSTISARKVLRTFCMTG